MILDNYLIPFFKVDPHSCILYFIQFSIWSRLMTTFYHYLILHYFDLFTPIHYLHFFHIVILVQSKNIFCLKLTFHLCLNLLLQFAIIISFISFMLVRSKHIFCLLFTFFFPLSTFLSQFTIFISSILFLFVHLRNIFCFTTIFSSIPIFPFHFTIFIFFHIVRACSFKEYLLFHNYFPPLPQSVLFYSFSKNNRI